MSGNVKTVLLFVLGTRWSLYLRTYWLQVRVYNQYSTCHLSTTEYVHVARKRASTALSGNVNTILLVVLSTKWSLYLRTYWLQVRVYDQYIPGVIRHTLEAEVINSLLICSSRSYVIWYRPESVWWRCRRRSQSPKPVVVGGRQTRCVLLAGCWTLRRSLSELCFEYVVQVFAC